MRVRGDAETAPVDCGGAYVVDETPDADATAGSAWQRSSHWEGADMAGAAFGDLEHRWFGGGGLGFGDGVRCGDGAAYDVAAAYGKTRQMAAR